MKMGLIIDNFAGGGGASTGIEAAGLRVDIAINHDPEAVAMHCANHPHTKHYVEDVWEIDPREVTKGQHVDLVWLSPDCKHFSRAKGGKPISKRIRSLAWVALKWAGSVRPDVIMLENVGEFTTWGPLIAARDKATGRVLKMIPGEEMNDGIKRKRGKKSKLYPVVAAPGEVVPVAMQYQIPDKTRKGKYFRRFVSCLQALGYVVEWRELKACDYGAPTIRTRFFLVARCDGLPIAWPEPTHGPGRPLPYRTAADCIDWSIPCPSIFDRARPLAVNTERRIARGIDRFVINNPKPFVISLNHTADYYQFFRGQGIDAPLGTLTQTPGYGLVSPHITKFRTGSPGQPADVPLHTVTACSVGEANHPGGAAPFGVVAAQIASYYGDKSDTDVRGSQIDQPLGTQTTENRHAVVATALEKCDSPAAACIVKQNFGEKPCHGLDEPLHAITTQGNKFQLAEAFIAKHFTGVVGADLADPMPTVTSVDHNSLVEAHIVRQFTKGTVGSACDEPVGSITAGGSGKTTLAASSLIHLKGTCKDGQEIDRPLRAISAQGTHFAEVRAFLVKYYNTNVGQKLDTPMHTLTAIDRLGLVTVYGELYAIADIGMRMLQPRELFRAQGFPETYIIDFEHAGKKLSKSAQVRMVGNSVCPPVATALVRANIVDMEKRAVA